MNLNGEFKVSYDLNDLKLDNLKSLEIDALYNSLRLLTKILKNSPIGWVVVGDKNRDEIYSDSISGLYAEIKELQSKFLSFAQRGEIVEYVETLKDGNDYTIIFPFDDKIMNSYFNAYIQMFLNCASFARKIENVNKRNLSKEQYLNFITRNNKKFYYLIGDIVEFSQRTESKLVVRNQDKVLGVLEAFGKDSSEELFMSVLNAFITLTEGLDIKYFKKDALEDDEQTKKQISQQKTKSLKQNISEAEKERISAIEMANDLYQELCLDFMRDLENQYALSSRDMYEYFVNVKFKKFVEKFDMPLSSETSLGKANECYGQIKRLMEYVSLISENSYNTSIYQ